jgi:hypothetical protein
MPQLKELVISCTAISDVGLSHVASLRGLQHLDLLATSVTDAGLQQLRGLSSLSALDVEIGNGITMQGVDRLKAQLPHCVIHCWGRGGALVATR